MLALTRYAIIAGPVKKKRLLVYAYMNPEKKLPPEWVRHIDLHWIEENYAVFQRVALRDMQFVGRGALAVDIASPPIAGGHPVVYWSQAHIQEHGNEEMRRLVASYDLEQELVVMLLKPGNEISSYRVCLVFP